MSMNRNKENMFQLLKTNESFANQTFNTLLEVRFAQPSDFPKPSLERIHAVIAKLGDNLLVLHDFQVLLDGKLKLLKLRSFSSAASSKVFSSNQTWLQRRCVAAAKHHEIEQHGMHPKLTAAFVFQNW